MLITDFISAFRQGKELANAEVWKNRAVAGGALTSLLTAVFGISRSFGYDFGIDQQTVEQAGYGIAAVVSAVLTILHVVTSERVGLPANLPPVSPGGDQRAGDSKPADPLSPFNGTS